MDPITIAAAIPSALTVIYKVSRRIRTFVTNVKEVRDAIDGLTQELAAVDSSLNVLDRCLPLLLTPETDDEAGLNIDNPVYAAIADIIISCKGTLERFEQAVDGLGDPNRSRMGRIGVQIRLDWSRDHINACRSQLQTHIGLLNLAGQMVNLQATIAASTNVVGDLRPGIDEIIARLEQISPAVNIHSNHGPDERLRESADLLVTHARSIVVQTEAATSMSGEEGEILPNTITDFLGWRPLVSRPMTVPPTLILGTELRSIAPAIPECVESEDDDSDTVCDVNIDLIENWLVFGRQQFDIKNYDRAKSLLTNGIEKAKTLPGTMRNDFDIKSSELTLADCYFHLGELDEARSRLQSLVQDQSSVKPSPYVLRVQHLLTQVLFHQGHLEEAEVLGARVLNGRLRFKKISPDHYYETATLMSTILAAQGRSDEAEVHRMLIPSAARLSLVNSESSSLFPPATSIDHSAVSFGASPETISGDSIDIQPQATAQSVTARGLLPIDTLVRPLGSPTESAGPLLPPSIISTLTDSARPLQLASEVSILTESAGPLLSPSIASTSSQVFSEQSRQETMTTVAASRASTSASASTRRSLNPFRRASSNARPAELCKGTTAIKKWGLDEGMKTVLNDLSNNYSERYQACKECKFRGPPYPGKLERNRDPISGDDDGLRYKFSFLAAAHIKCETRGATPTYKCVICTAEHSGSDVSHTENELIQHISVEHAYKTSLGIQKATKCFFGPIDDGTPWSVHMP